MRLSLQNWISKIDGHIDLYYAPRFLIRVTNPKLLFFCCTRERVRVKYRFFMKC